MKQMDSIKDASLGAVVGMVVAALINLGIFATKADVLDVKVWVAENYTSKAVVDRKFESLEHKLETYFERLSKKIDQLNQANERLKE